MTAKPAVLVTGARGGLANLIVNLLSEKYDLVGVDPRPLHTGVSFPGHFYQVDYTKRKMAEIFRQHHFESMLHLGRIPLTAKADRYIRFNLNVLGTRNLFELAAKHQIKKTVISSTFHVYGANQANPLHLNEEDSLGASYTYPELSDAVDFDLLCSNFILRHRQIQSVLLRPANIIGPTINNQITRLLRGKYCPTLLGYDPLQQFVHESDFASAILLALEGAHSGIYNVAGEGVIPFSRAITLAGGTAVPIPHFLIYPGARSMSLMGVHYPRYLIDYFRYPTVISDKAFRRDYGYAPRVSTVDALKSIRISR